MLSGWAEPLPEGGLGEGVGRPDARRSDPGRKLPKQIEMPPSPSDAYVGFVNSPGSANWDGGATPLLLVFGDAALAHLRVVVCERLTPRSAIRSRRS
jgi:hypothetical protein